MGWTLLLEYLIAACLVSVGWSAYTTGIFSAAGIMLPLITWARFIAWMAVGILAYAVYGYRRSNCDEKV